MVARVFPCILIALDCAASAVYAAHGDVRRCIYWAAAAAARLGVSRTQLREVINGNRKSKRLMARLRDAGIKVVA